MKRMHEITALARRGRSCYRGNAEALARAAALGGDLACGSGGIGMSVYWGTGSYRGTWPVSGPPLSFAQTQLLVCFKGLSALF